jgi:hypothetical protein
MTTPANPPATESAHPAAGTLPPSRSLSPNPFIVAAILLVIGLIGFGGYRASEYQGMQTLRTDAGHRLDLFAAAVDGIVNRYAHIPATIQLSEEVLGVMHQRPGDGQRAGGQPLPAAPQRAHRQHRHLRGGRARHRHCRQQLERPGQQLRRRGPVLPQLLSGRGSRGGSGATSPSASPGASRATSSPTPSARATGWWGWPSSRSAWVSSTRPGICSGAPALIADGNGVVILSSVPEWRYTALTPLPLDTRVDISMSRLYNGGPIGDFPGERQPGAGAGGADRAHEAGHPAPGGAGRAATPMWPAATWCMAAACRTWAGAC